MRRRPGDDPKVALAIEDLLAPSVPTMVEAPPVTLQPIRRCLVRRVSGTGREPQQERLARLVLGVVDDEPDGLIGQVFG